MTASKGSEHLVASTAASPPQLSALKPTGGAALRAGLGLSVGFGWQRWVRDRWVGSGDNIWHQQLGDGVCKMTAKLCYQKRRKVQEPPPALPP